MNELLSSGLWTRIRKLAKTAHKKSAAVAYVTDDRFIKFANGDVLITDASDEAIKAGLTSAPLLKAAFWRKAQLVSVPRLHSKVYVFDRCAVIGSANLSQESERRTEVALLTDQPSVVSSAKLFIEQLKTQGEAIDEAFISRISKLPVQKRKSFPKGRQRIRVHDLTPRTWLVGLHPLEEKEDEQDVVEKGRVEAEKHMTYSDSSVSFLRFTGNSRFRREARKGDLVIQLWASSTKEPFTSAYYHAPVLHRTDDRASNVTRFFLEEHFDAEDTALTWKQFQSLYSQLGLPPNLGKWPVREIPKQHSDALHDLWPTFEE